MGHVPHVNIGKHSFPLCSHPVVRAEVCNEKNAACAIDRHLSSMKMKYAVTITDNVKEQLQREAECCTDPRLNVMTDRVAVTYAGKSSDACHLPLPGKYFIPALGFLKGEKKEPASGQQTLPDSSQVCAPQWRRLAPKERTRSKKKPASPPASETTREEAVCESSHEPPQACSGLPPPPPPPPPATSTRKARTGRGGRAFPMYSQQNHRVSSCPRSRFSPCKFRHNRRFRLSLKDDSQQLYYSNLSLHLTDRNILTQEEMDVRGEGQKLFKVQGAYLSSLCPKGFASLHIILDGNTSIIRCLPKDGTDLSPWRDEDEAVALNGADDVSNQGVRRECSDSVPLQALSAFRNISFTDRDVTFDSVPLFADASNASKNRSAHSAALSRAKIPCGPWGLRQSTTAVIPTVSPTALKLPNVTYRSCMLQSSCDQVQCDSETCKT
uniref:Uncharacterized protein n=1 Tax=Trypanosoma vivax (strain Y486) TaxID=1055687 RepID=G0UBB6_TRYVY|nr:conserved hypothetical protein [Trypanosoma vivax Y486]